MLITALSDRKLPLFKYLLRCWRSGVELHQPDISEVTSYLRMWYHWWLVFKLHRTFSLRALKPTLKDKRLQLCSARGRTHWGCHQNVLAGAGYFFNEICWEIMESGWCHNAEKTCLPPSEKIFSWTPYYMIDLTLRVGGNTTTRHPGREECFSPTVMQIVANLCKKMTQKPLKLCIKEKD